MVAGKKKEEQKSLKARAAGYAPDTMEGELSLFFFFLTYSPEFFSSLKIIITQFRFTVLGGIITL